MRMEQLDKLTNSIRTQEAVARPRVPASPETGATRYERPLDIESLNPDATAAILSRTEDEAAQLSKRIDEANVFAEAFPNQGIYFALERSAGGLLVLVIDKETDEVVRRMSPKAFLGFMACVYEAVGLFFDKLV